MSLWIACKSTQSTTVVPQENVSTDDPQILFLLYNITRLGDTIQVLLEQAIYAQGVLKDAHLDNEAMSVGDWRCTVADVDGRQSISHRIDRPLSYRAEYVNDKGELETKNIERQNATITVRLPIRNWAHHVILERMTEEGIEQLHNKKL